MSRTGRRTPQNRRGHPRHEVYTRQSFVLLLPNAAAAVTELESGSCSPASRLPGKHRVRSFFRRNCRGRSHPGVLASHSRPKSKRRPTWTSVGHRTLVRDITMIPHLLYANAPHLHKGNPVGPVTGMTGYMRHLTSRTEVRRPRRRRVEAHQRAEWAEHSMSATAHTARQRRTCQTEGAAWRSPRTRPGRNDRRHRSCSIHPPSAHTFSKLATRAPRRMKKERTDRCSPVGR